MSLEVAEGLGNESLAVGTLYLQALEEQAGRLLAMAESDPQGVPGPVVATRIDPSTCANDSAFFR